MDNGTGRPRDLPNRLPETGPFKSRATLVPTPVSGSGVDVEVHPSSARATTAPSVSRAPPGRPTTDRSRDRVPRPVDTRRIDPTGPTRGRTRSKTGYPQPGHPKGPTRGRRDGNRRPYPSQSVNPFHVPEKVRGLRQIKK